MRTLFFMAAFALAGCAHFKDSNTVCAEYRGIRCVVGRPECAYDRVRGCEVCHCDSRNPFVPVDAPR